MPTSYTSLLGLALPVTGELSGTWGDTVNDYITKYVDAAVAGAQTISGSQTAVTLSTTTATSLSQAGSGSTGSAQYSIINCTGNPASALTVTVPSTSKVYLVLNNTSTNQTVTVKGAATTGVTVAAARAALIAWNGTDFELVATDDASKMNGILAVANGGTGSSTASGARTNLGATTLGSNLFTITNPSAITFPRFNADNTVSALNAADFRTAIGAGTGGGTVTSVSWTGGIVSIANATTTPAFTIAGTSGGIPYFSSASTWATSAALAANSLVIGGGAGVAPSTITTGTGVVTALGVNTGTAGAFVVNGGALGTPSSGTVTNLTGTASININGTVGATTPNTGAFTSVTSTSASGVLTRAAATQDGVAMVGRAGGTSSYTATFTPTTLSASRTMTIPDNSGTLLTTGATVTVAQGGTGATTLTANNVILGNGTSAVQFVAPGTAGNVLTSNGTTWTSAAAGASLSGVTDSAPPYETALGYQAGNSNTGARNTFLGFQSGFTNTTGTDNTAVGMQSLYSNTFGLANDAYGYRALYANTTGGGNAGFGYFALNANTTGGSNSAFGNSALASNTTGTNNTAVGYLALYANTTGSNNTAVGYQALDANTTGEANTAIGRDALGANTTGIYNVAVGNLTAAARTTMRFATVIGYGALQSATSNGDTTIAIGYGAMNVSTNAGSRNIAIGSSSLNNINGGSDNIGIGTDAGIVVSTGNNNVLIGNSAGFSGTNNLTTGSNNILIGYNAAASSATVSNEVTIGNSSVTSFRIPGLSVTWGANTVPYRNLPPVGTKTGSYTLAVADVGKYVQVGSGGSITIPDATFAEGDAVSIFNNTTGNITITCSITTAYIAGTDTDKATMTLATRGVATILFISSTICVVSGNVT